MNIGNWEREFFNCIFSLVTIANQQLSDLWDSWPRMTPPPSSSIKSLKKWWGQSYFYDESLIYNMIFWIKERNESKKKKSHRANMLISPRSITLLRCSLAQNGLISPTCEVMLAVKLKMLTTLSNSRRQWKKKNMVMKNYWNKIFQIANRHSSWNKNGSGKEDLK